MQGVLSQTVPSLPKASHLHAVAFPQQTGVPFQTVEEAWFWFICSVEAREQGAVPGRSRGALPRPCEPIDIYRVLERLHRNRRLRFEHFQILNTFGRRHMAPEPFRRHEARAHQLWKEAMKELDTVLQRRGVVRSIFKPTEVI